jgi:transcriptional regulator with XRE-family HTH domain
VTYERLRESREENGLSLEELCRRTGIRPKTLELIDSGEFAELPAGLYCRSAIRAYASAVGLDADEVLEALRPYLPVPEDPLDGLARRHGHARKAEQKLPELLLPSLASQADVGSEQFPEPLLFRARPAGPVEDSDLDVRLTSTDEVSERATLSDVMIRAEASPETNAADSAPGPDPLTPGRQWWRPLVASAIDGALLASMGGALVWLTALACGTTIPVALRTAAPGVALVFALIVTLYFVLFGGIGNATLGATLMRLDAPPPGRVVLNPRDVFGRARRSVIGVSSLLPE